MRKRLRKKLHVDEFQELGCEVGFQVDANLTRITRAVSSSSSHHKYVDGIHRLVDIVQDLEHKGLMRSEGEGPQPRYWITDAERKLIAEQEAHIG